MVALLNTLPNEIDRIAYCRNENFVASFFGVDVETVRGWRKKRMGPPWRRVGGRVVRYSLADLCDFLESQPQGGQSSGRSAA